MVLAQGHAGGRLMRERIAADLSALPLHGKETVSLTWWGTCAFMLIEGTGFALVIAIYLYLMSVAPSWPINSAPPALGPGSFVTLILVASLVPNFLIARWAAREDLRKVRIGLLVMTAFGIAPLIVRIFEFPAMLVLWDTNAYGSTVWLILGLHTTHIITDLGDTVVLAALMFTRYGNSSRRFGDVQDNALYWYFVVLTWLPLYGCLYWVPRL
jgi:heme/copper-type cytochrome/quinol oxidase subunit 3